MANHVLNSKWLPLALLSLGVVSGCCCQAYPLPGEDQCPTDARRMYLSCGEEAVRRCPCGPDHEFYGLKPTSWRTWPDGWRAYAPVPGGPGCDEAVSCGDSVNCGESIGEAPAGAASDVSNPFRNDASPDERPPQPVAEEPLPVQAAAPVQTPPAASAAAAPPAQIAPAEAAPLTPAPLDVAPMVTAPAVTPPVEYPAAQNPLMETTPAKTAPAVVLPPQTPAFDAPAARTTPIDVTPPQTAPVEQPRVKVPPLTPPQEAPPKPSAANPNKQAEAPAVAHQEEIKKPAPTPQPVAPKRAEGSLSDRVEQHLFNNLQM